MIFQVYEFFCKSLIVQSWARAMFKNRITELVRKD